jgi:hypothetical protein
MWDAYHNPADYGENIGRGRYTVVLHVLPFFIKKTPTAMACEVLARRIIHLTEPDNIKSVMSMRYKYRQMDGDESEMSNALELAIDQHWCFYASNSSIMMTKTRLYIAQYSYHQVNLRKARIFHFSFLWKYMTFAKVVNALWNGDLIQKNNVNNEIDCE